MLAIQSRFTLRKNSYGNRRSDSRTREYRSLESPKLIKENNMEDNEVKVEYDEPDSYWLEYYEEAAFYGE